jgi:hypothetical protein
LADDSCSAAACAAAGATIAALVLLKNPISCSARKDPPADTNLTLRLSLTAAGSFLPSVLPPPRPIPRLSPTQLLLLLYLLAEDSNWTGGCPTPARLLIIIIITMEFHFPLQELQHRWFISSPPSCHHHH